MGITDNKDKGAISLYFQRFHLQLSLVISSLIVVYFASKSIQLYDLSHFLNTGLKISKGDVPYRDFHLIHNPLSFYLQALLIKLGANNYLLNLLWMFLVNFYSGYFVFSILKEIINDYKTRYILAILTTCLGPFSMYSELYYDADSIFIALLSLWLYIKFKSTTKDFYIFFSGFTTFLVFLIKQNTGSAFLLTMILFVTFDLIKDKKKLKNYYFGLVVSIFLFIIYLVSYDIVTNWIHQAIQFAADERLKRKVPNLALSYLFTTTERSNFEYPITHQLFLGSIYYFYIVFIFSNLLRKYFKNHIEKLISKKIVFLVVPFLLYVLQKLIIGFSILLFGNYFVDFFLINRGYLFGIIVFTFLLSYSIIFIEKFNYENIELYFPTLFTLYILFLVFSGMYGVNNYSDFAALGWKVYLTTIYFYTVPLLSSISLKAIFNFNKYGILMPLITFYAISPTAQGLYGSTHSNNFIVPALFFVVYFSKEKNGSNIKLKIKNLNINKQLITACFLFLFLFMPTIFQSRYIGIDLTGESVGNNELFLIETRGDYLLNQSEAKEIIIKYNKITEKYIFIPTQGLGYYLANIKPYSVFSSYEAASPINNLKEENNLEIFLDCYLVEYVVVNTKNQDFKPFDDQEYVQAYLGSNYKFHEGYESFDVYININETSKKKEDKEICRTLKNEIFGR